VATERFDVTPFERLVHDGARALPFPLATAAWSARTATNREQRVDKLLGFLEAAARFVAIVNLTVIRTDRATFEAARPALQGRDRKPSEFMRQATLGSWVNLNAAIAKSLRRQPGVDQAALYSVLGTGPLYQPLISRDLGGVFESARTLRNEDAHAGSVSVTALDTLIDELQQLVGSFWELTNPVWRRWHLIRPGAGTYRRGVFTYELEQLTGDSYPFRRSEAEFDRTLESGGLYLWEDGAKSALQLLPFIRLIFVGEEREACYFFSSIEAGKMRWVSYQREGVVRSEQTDADLLAIIMDLDSPAVPTATPGPSEPVSRREPRRRVLPSGEREATVILGRVTLPDGRGGFRFTVMAQATGGHFGVPASARVGLGLEFGDDIYVEVRRTGRNMPALGTAGELVFQGVTEMRSGSEVYYRKGDQHTKGLDRIGPNEVLDVIVAVPSA